VRDSGGALPEEFHVESSSHLGLAIVKTVAEDDLRGTLSFLPGAETVISVTVPIDGTG